jgi:hypothetical protein
LWPTEEFRNDRRYSFWYIGAQLGKSFGVKIIIDEFSSPDNRDIPVLTFQKGEHDGLVNAA